MAKAKGNLVGAWAFLIGVVLALVMAIFQAQLGPTSQSGIIGLLLIAGILVGLLNVGTKDSSKFLLAGLALVIVANFGSAAISSLEVIPAIGSFLRILLNQLLILFVPATIIVALKSVFEIAKE
jgi:hypothetical protein